MRIVVALSIALAASAGATPRAGFAAYPRARLLCSEHVTGNSMHVTWSTYGSRDPVDVIVKHYTKTTGRIAKAGPKGEQTLEWDATHTLSVYPAGKHADFPHCAKRPARDEKSVILMSSAARP